MIDFGVHNAKGQVKTERESTWEYIVPGFSTEYSCVIMSKTYAYIS